MLNFEYLIAIIVLSKLYRKFYFLYHICEIPSIIKELKLFTQRIALFVFGLFSIPCDVVRIYQIEYFIIG